MTNTVCDFSNRYHRHFFGHYIYLLHTATVNVMRTTGKAVFCEKPISQDESGIRACYEQAEKANKPLFCAFNRYNDYYTYLFFTYCVQ